jgi:hypothetical protein
MGVFRVYEYVHFLPFLVSIKQDNLGGPGVHDILMVHRHGKSQDTTVTLN